MKRKSFLLILLYLTAGMFSTASALTIPLQYAANNNDPTLYTSPESAAVSWVNWYCNIPENISYFLSCTYRGFGPNSQDVSAPLYHTIFAYYANLDIVFPDGTTLPFKNGTATYWVCPQSDYRFAWWDPTDQTPICYKPDPVQGWYVSTSLLPNTQCGPAQNCVGEPINPVSGAVFDKRMDTLSTPNSIVFERFYDSTYTGFSKVGNGWRHAFSRYVTARRVSSRSVPSYISGAGTSSLYADPATACASGFTEIQSQMPSWSGVIATYSSGNCQLTKGGVSVGSLTLYSNGGSVSPAAQPIAYDVVRDDGQLIRFTVINGVITAPPGSSLQLAQTGSGYSLTDSANAVEQYDVNGKLLSVTSRSGVVQTMTYDDSNRLSSVVDNFGHQLTLGYDTQNRLISVTRQ